MGAWADLDFRYVMDGERCAIVSVQRLRARVGWYNRAAIAIRAADGSVRRISMPLGEFNRRARVVGVEVRP